LTEPLESCFFLIYVLCGLSDILDGYIARKTNTTSKLGERLDSIGDLIMVIILTVMLYPIIKFTFFQILWILGIVLIRVISIIIIFLKFKTFAILHTYANKMTGLLLFVLIPLLAFVDPNILIYITCIAGSYSAIEELTIHLSSDCLEGNRKSIFSKFI